MVYIYISTPGCRALGCSASDTKFHEFKGPDTPDSCPRSRSRGLAIYAKRRKDHSNWPSISPEPESVAA